MENHNFHGKTHYQWTFSIAMLVTTGGCMYTWALRILARQVTTCHNTAMPSAEDIGSGLHDGPSHDMGRYSNTCHL